MKAKRKQNQDSGSFSQNYLVFTQIVSEWKHPDDAKIQANLQACELKRADCLITESTFLDVFCLVILHYNNTANHSILFILSQPFAKVLPCPVINALREERQNTLDTIRSVGLCLVEL